MTIGTRIITKDRKPLYTLLPLESPLVLFIDPSDACNSKCGFCPTSDNQLMKEVKRPLKQMNFPLYKKIIDDLQEFETKIKVVRLYGHGEPLLNKHFCDMVRYAKESGKVETVDTTTNGLLLNPKLNKQLADSGIDRINISVNGLSEEQYKNFAGIKVDFKKYIENIKNLYNNKKNIYLFIKINGDTITNEEEQQFLNIFEPIADSVAIEKSMQCWQGFEPKGFIRQENNIGIYGQAINREVICCPYVQYSIFINSDGLIVPCFLDWGMKMGIDYIQNISLYDIWNKGVFYKFQEYMLQLKRKGHFYCKNCQQLIGGMPEDIDGYVKDILNRRYTNKNSG